MTETPKRGGCGRNIVIVVIVLIVAIVICGIVGVVVLYPAVSGVVNSIKAAQTTSNDFMTALVAKDYTKAYGMVHPSEQADFGGSADGMQQKFASSGLEPTNFSLTNTQVGQDALANGTGTFGGATKYVYIGMRKDGDTWKILSLDVNDNAPTATPVGTP